MSSDDDIFDEIDQEFDLLAEDLDPNVRNILEQKSLRWIFVGGKGGVGKTTCSSSLGILLSEIRDTVLIISTDPAHSLSDSFGQRFSKKPTLVDGFDNLYAMEIDPSTDSEDTTKELLGEDEGLMSVMKEMVSSFPGIDEAISFTEIIKVAKEMNFDAIVFDTAPTGHTLRLLSLPQVLGDALSKVLNSSFSSILDQVGSFVTGGGDGTQNKLKELRDVSEDIKKQFTNADLTTFVCVCIPEFLSLYETERLVQSVTNYGIDVSNIIVNQVLVPEKGSNCKLCKSREEMQKKYLTQIDDLYEDFHVTKLSLQKEEVRGVDNLKSFSKLLLQSEQ